MLTRTVVVFGTVLFSLGTAGQSGPPMRFDGLDRLYFERMNDPGRGARRADAVSCLLPEQLPPGSCARAAADEEMLSVRDLPLTAGIGSPRAVLLRQVHDRGQRITEQWWCLYQDGRRSECWFFTPDPRRTDNKLLAEYTVEEIQSPEPGRIVFRACGAMFRPQGAWWWHAKDFAFTVSGNALRFDHVVGRFNMSHGYDTGDKEPRLSVSTERPVPGSDRLEMRSVDAVTDASMARCGYRDPLSADGEPLTCSELERAALCMTSGSDAAIASRARNTPSFIERNGK